MSLANHPNALSGGAGPSIGVIAGGTIYGLNGQTITGNASGAWAVAANGTNQNITLTPSGTGVVKTSGSETGGGITVSATNNLTGQRILNINNNSDLFRIGLEYDNPTPALNFVDRNRAVLLRLLEAGGLLVGTSVNSSALLQIGTNTTTSAGGVVFGTDTFLYRNGNRSILLDSASTNTQLNFGVAGVQIGVLLADTTNFSIGANKSGASTLILSGPGTTALTLNSSQNATFAGNLTVNGAATTLAGNLNVNGTGGLLVSASNANESGRLVVRNNASGGWGDKLSIIGTQTDGSTTRTMGEFLASGTGTWADAANSSSNVYVKNLNAGSLVNAIVVSGAGNVAVAGNLTVSGTGTSSFAGALADANGNVRQLQQNPQSAAYTTVLSDGGKQILHPTADNNARTFTIDSNANVAYPIGTAITFVNQINTVTIAITSDTLVLAGTGATGSRTLAANGIATALKIASTTWIISGTGIT